MFHDSSSPTPPISPINPFNVNDVPMYEPRFSSSMLYHVDDEDELRNIPWAVTEEIALCDAWVRTSKDSHKGHTEEEKGRKFDQWSGTYRRRKRRHHPFCRHPLLGWNSPQKCVTDEADD
ncbi:hypothetical protein Tco_1479506 [Tanacetum coccineum]